MLEAGFQSIRHPPFFGEQQGQDSGSWRPKSTLSGRSLNLSLEQLHVFVLAVGFTYPSDLLQTSTSDPIWGTALDACIWPKFGEADR